MASSLRTGVSLRYGVQHLPIRSSYNLATLPIVHNIASTISRHRRLPLQRSANIHYIRPTVIAAQPQLQLRAYAASSKEPTADNLIEDLQDVYGIAKDLFETASDSTEKESIHAEDDQESARDALNQLLTVYEAYTTGETGAEIAGGDGASEEGEPGLVVRTNFDPRSISSTVMEDVRKRFGQKVDGLRNAVEALEEKS